MANLSKVKRTISSETMSNVMKYAPKDGFKLTDDMLNKTYTLVDVEEYEVGGTKTFSATMEDEDGKVITLSASALKRSRVFKGNDIGDAVAYTDTKNVFLRSKAESIWNGSSYFHKGLGMKKDDDFTLPEKLKLRYAVLAENQDDGQPLLNPYLYKEFRKVVKMYSAREEYPTMDDFREELLKSEAEGRLSFLPLSMTEPEAYSWVKQEVSDFRHTLIFEEK